MTRIITALLNGRLEWPRSAWRVRQRMCQTSPGSWLSRGSCMRGAATPIVLFSVSAVRWSSPRSFGHTHHVHHHAACVYALLGDVDRAMAWLERAADAGFPCWPFFRIDPHLENLRDSARIHSADG